MVGKVPVGGDAPITVQSMTNTLTADAAATIAQIRALEEAGADIVRVSCPDEESTRGAEARSSRAAKVPIVADIHFHYKRAIEAAEAGAACLRINPGNIGSRRARARGGEGGQGPWLLDAHRRQCRRLETRPAGEIRRALPGGDGRKRAQPRAHSRGQRFPRVQDQRARRPTCSSPSPPIRAWPRPATIRCISASPRRAACAPARSNRRSASASLLWAGIGDTIRVSLSADPVEEVKVGFEMLKSLGLRHRGVNVDLLPVLRAPAVRRHPHRRGAGGAARAYHDAHDRLGHRLRRQRPGRGARDRYRLHRRRQRHASWSISPASRTTG